MTDKPMISNEVPQSRDKLIAAFLAAWSTSYIMTQASLKGVNFELLGISSELVKSTIIAHLVAFFVWATPRNIVQAIRELILFIRETWKTWRDAALEGKE